MTILPIWFVVSLALTLAIGIAIGRSSGREQILKRLTPGLLT